jgi:hypothetical protein
LILCWCCWCSTTRQHICRIATSWPSISSESQICTRPAFFFCRKLAFLLFKKMK